VYKGPVGNAPELSEEEFLERMKRKGQVELSVSQEEYLLRLYAHYRLVTEDKTTGGRGRTHETGLESPGLSNVDLRIIHSLNKRGLTRQKGERFREAGSPYYFSVIYGYITDDGVKEAELRWGNLTLQELRRKSQKAMGEGGSRRSTSRK